jgi:hypothetical protein
MIENFDHSSFMVVESPLARDQILEGLDDPNQGSNTDLEQRAKQAWSV